jgi:DNA mismatch repair protein MutS
MLKRLAPNAFSESWISFESMKMIFSLFRSTGVGDGVGVGDGNCGDSNTYFQLDEKMLERYELFMKSFGSYFDQEEMLNHNMVNIKGSFFKKGVFSEVDDLQKAFDNCYQKLVNIQQELSSMLGNGIEVEINSTKCDGYFLKTTTTRSNLIKKELKVRGELEKYQFKKKQSNSSTCRIYSADIIDLSSSLMMIQEELAQVAHQKYLETLELLGSEYCEVLDYVVSCISEIDLLISYVKVSQKYGYCRPVICESGEESCIQCDQIRHPVIERVLVDYPYVPNSLELSGEDGVGLLLYGINGSGKSSLAKAIGLNIIMAQMGMYVAATQFVYYPFKTIFTRISDGDNIFKGYSSFAVEMNDLRSLIRYGDKWSLVLGDEVCKGTENVSAVSIVAASLQHFVERGVKFIFATHLHQLPKLECIQELGTAIKVKHLSVTYKDGEIIYGRRLLEGQGSSIYGLEVAKHIIHNDKFILNAERIRKQLMGVGSKLLEEKSSKYNADLYVDQCEICGGKEGLDVHHIKFQSECDQHGLYQHIPKNIIGNLVVLCKSDHMAVHGGKLLIDGWVESSEGRKLDWRECEVEEMKKIKRGRLKYSEEDVAEIMKSKDMKGITSMKNILVWLKDKGYKLSSQTLKKIWDEKYFE